MVSGYGIDTMGMLEIHKLPPPHLYKFIVVSGN